MTRNRIVAVALAALAVIGIGVSASSTSSTQAAWTDEVYVTATATAGSWHAAGENSCTAVDANGADVPCSVSRVSYSSWGGNDSTRDYWVEFNVPPGTAWVTFTADLSTGVPREGSPAQGAWVWANATIRADGAQFIPTDDWTSADLPVVAGRSRWQWASNVFFVVDRDGFAGETLIG